MERKPKMRILKRDEKEFNRLRRNYRAKLNRIKKATGFDTSNFDKWLDVEIPTLRDFKSGKAFTDRDEYNAWKKQLATMNARNFSPLQIETNTKGMSYPKIVKTKGVQATQGAKEKAQSIKSELADKTVFIDGEERGSVSDIESSLRPSESYGIYEPEEFDIDRYANPNSVLKNIQHNEERQTDEYYDERMKQMLDNYISIFMDTTEENEELVRRLSTMNPRDFYELYLRTPAMAFEEFDSETGEHITGQKSASDILTTYLDKYDRGEIDLSLKNIG